MLVPVVCGVILQHHITEECFCKVFPKRMKGRKRKRQEGKKKCSLPLPQSSLTTSKQKPSSCLLSAPGKHSDYWQYFVPFGCVSHPQKELQYSWERGEFFLCLSLKSLWVAMLLARPCQGWGCISHTHVALTHFWIDAHERKNSSQNIEWKLRQS